MVQQNQAHLAEEGGQTQQVEQQDHSNHGYERGVAG